MFEGLLDRFIVFLLFGHFQKLIIRSNVIQFEKLRYLYSKDLLARIHDSARTRDLEAK